MFGLVAMLHDFKPDTACTILQVTVLRLCFEWAVSVSVAVAVAVL